MNDYCFPSVLAEKAWMLFSNLNGNPDFGNFGARFFLGLFFSSFLFIIISMRAKASMQKMHIVALMGALMLIVRFLLLFVFEWSFQIHLHNDKMVYFLFPPIEHFFEMLGFGCLAYYSLHSYRYYPGMLKKILWYIPTSFFTFFIYTTIVWKSEFMLNYPNIIIKYKESMVDWQSHLIISLLALYMVAIAIFKFNKNHHYLSAFWTITLIEHSVRTVCFYNNFEPSWLATIFHAMSIWSLPILILHFVKAYVVKLRYCEYCSRNTEIQ